jgi:hypothetical protein
MRIKLLRDLDLTEFVHETFRPRVHVQRFESIEQAYPQKNHWLPVRSPWPVLLELLAFAALKAGRRFAETRRQYARELAGLFQLPELVGATELLLQSERDRQNRYRQARSLARGLAVQLCAARPQWPVNGKILERAITILRLYGQSEL